MSNPRCLFQEGIVHSIADVFVYAEGKKEYEYIWAVQLDKVVLGKFPEKMSELQLDKLIEARIFSNGQEIHIFKMDDWEAVETINWKEEYYDETQLIKKADRKRFGSSIQIRHYIEVPDGTEANSEYQCYICGSCLNGWEE